MARELLEPLTLTKEESRQAQEMIDRLALHLDGRRELRIQIVVDDQPQETLAIPAGTLRLLADILTHMAQGKPVTLIPMEAELTTYQAADFLNTSHEFAVRLTEQGELPFRATGTVRRILFRDLLEYKQRTDAAREATLSELAAQAQELGLGY